MEAKLTRRVFLRNPLGKPEDKIPQKENIVHIRKPEGTYSIIYNDQAESQDPQRLPPALDGLVLETPWNWSKDPLGYLQACRQTTIYQPLFPTLEENSTPVFFADLGYRIDNLGNLKPSELLDLAVLVAEIGIGAKLLTTKTSRREFLNITKVALGLWLLTPAGFLSDLLPTLTTHGREQTAEIIKSVEGIHPESLFFTLQLRDIVLAHKEEWLMKGGPKGHLGTVIGGLHTGIENWLKRSSQERLEFLSRARPFFKDIVVPDTFYEIIRFEFNKDRWKVAEIFEVPELKALVA